MWEKVRVWVPLAIAITLLAGLVYGTAQQVIRLGANEQLVQISEDMANDLSRGQEISGQVGQKTVEMSESLSTYVMVFDSAGKVTSTTGALNGQVRTPPVGVLEFARVHGQDRVTWQPEPGVRQAIVVTHFAGVEEGWVLAGRSLREVENLDERLMMRVGLGWAVTMGLTLAAKMVILTDRKKR